MRQPKILIPTAMVLGGIGALVFNWQSILGGLLIVVGVIGALYSWWRSEATTEEYKSFIESQAFLIAKGGLGNTFTQSVKRELESGSFLAYEDTLRRLRRALELTPDDIETLELLSMISALKLSFASWAVQERENHDFHEAVAEAKSYAEKGLKLGPEDHILLGSLGIICDLERFANRVDSCKDVAHEHLLEGPKNQSGGSGGSENP